MPEPRNRVPTEGLMALLTLSVPQSAVRKTPAGIFVLFGRPLVRFKRRGGGWVALVVRPDLHQDEREFTTVDECSDLILELWPMDDATADAIVEDVSDSPYARGLDRILAVLQRTVPLDDGGDDDA